MADANTHWTFYPGQLDYLSRVAVKDAALIAAETGTGKSLMALALARLKLEQRAGSGERGATPGSALPAPSFTGRALIIAPQGTTRGDDGGDGEGNLSQWHQEIARFAAGVPVYDLMTWEQYEALVHRYGALPPGIYLSYFEAMFRNGAREFLPKDWPTTEAHFKLCEFYGLPPGPTRWMLRLKAATGEPSWQEWNGAGEPTAKVGDRYQGGVVLAFQRAPVHDYTKGLGDQRGRLHCLASPCLSTRILADHPWREQRLLRTTGPQDHGTTLSRRPVVPSSCPWDMVILDEAHVACHLDAQITQSFIRLQPRYRYAMTATPLPNIVSDLFPLMGWLCVPDWYQGERRNAAWPYAREDLGRFNAAFLSEERDYTQEAINEGRNQRWRGKCTKISPVLSSPARLLKLLKPTMAFISKAACNPNVVPCEVVDLRVPLGEQQSRLYEFYLDRRHIEGKNALAKARRQITLLRNICADPRSECQKPEVKSQNAPAVGSNYNPKTVTVLRLVLECLQRGEQAVVVSARTGQTDEYYFRLASAIGEQKLARIDSTVLPAEHAAEAERFKRGEARVMFMGIRCARGYSSDRCANLIIGSLEYSFGSLHQAKGRVWRVTSLGGWQPDGPRKVRVWCVLHQGTIEETMFDVVATKEDAATICLLGRRVPRTFKAVDLEEVLALSYSKLRNWKSEAECETQWPAMCEALRATQRVPAWMRRKLTQTTTTMACGATGSVS